MTNRLKGFLYDCIGWLARQGRLPRHREKKVLIVRVDEIGDFMLWHHFIKDLMNAQRFAGYRFYFCGNQSVRSIFETFDQTGVQQSFWLDKTRFKKQMNYRYRFLRMIHAQGFETVINPTFSRDKRYDDSIVQATQAPVKIGMAANLESVATYEEGYDRDLYTELFEHREKPIFEFLRNRLFTEFVTKEKSATQNTLVAKDRLPALNIEMPSKYFVVFPGSRSKKRIWPASHFIRVSDYLFETTGATAVVCGTHNDKEYINAFCDHYQHPLINLAGKTSLTQMLTVFAHAQCLFSVDTGSVHLAAAVGCPVFGIFNGSQYKRFAPYPASLAPAFHAIYPDEVEERLKRGEIEDFEFVVDIPYASVPPEKVILQLHQFLEAKGNIVS